jgi:hypothetical protein
MYISSPDLSLASSYVPACFCVFKSIVFFILFLLSPVRGWIALVSLLLTDRILWNQYSNLSLLDVNAVCVALVGGLMVMHAREDGVRSVFIQLGITAAWGLLSALQILNAAKLPTATEVIAAACFVSTLSCLLQPREIGEVMALRAFVFVMANVTLPYMGILLQTTDVDTYIIICRTLPILLGGPEVACAWVTVYVLCMGYQVKLSRGKPQQQQRYEHGSPEPKIVQQEESTCSSSTVFYSSAVSSEEASQLREALARKQCRDC